MYSTEIVVNCEKCMRMFLDSEVENLTKQFEKEGLADVLSEYAEEYKISISYKDVFLHVSVTKENHEYTFYSSVDMYSDPDQYIEYMTFIRDMSKMFCEILAGDSAAYRDEMVGFPEESDTVDFSMSYTEGSIENNFPF